MGDVRFEWAPNKSAANLKKHGISFEEATTVFFDENALLINDPDHSVDEQRFILMGFSDRMRILVVNHSYRAMDQIIRIISAARRARKNKDNIIKGGNNEKRLRFFKSQKESLYKISQEADYDSHR